MRPISLSVDGYRGEPVPNSFLRQRGETSHLAILLPGIGYTCDMPLFYYAQNLLVAAGADVLRVEYTYGRRSDFRDLPATEQLRWLLADATAAQRAGLAQRGYQDLTLIGKSLGTLAMGHLLTAQDVPTAATRAVWLTSLLREERLREQVRRYAGRSLFAIGAADPHDDPTYLAAMRTTPGGAVVVEGAGHGLDAWSDVVASIHPVTPVIRALQDFLAR